MRALHFASLPCLLVLYPNIQENLVSICLISINRCPRLEKVNMFIDLMLHSVSELFLVLMTFQVTVVCWNRWEISFMFFPSLEGRLPGLRYSLLAEIGESVISLLLIIAGSMSGGSGG